MRANITPFRLTVEWHDRESTHVWLERLGKFPKLLRSSRTPADAELVGWARRWFEGRGIQWWCDIDRHQMADDSYIVLHAVGLERAESAPQR